jgi:hypothetical protein
MIERGRSLCLLEKSPPGIGIAGLVRMERLYNYGTVQAGVSGFKHNSHATLPELFKVGIVLEYFA